MDDRAAVPDAYAWHLGRPPKDIIPKLAYARVHYRDGITLSSYFILDGDSLIKSESISADPDSGSQRQRSACLSYQLSQSSPLSQSSAITIFSMA